MSRAIKIILEAIDPLVITDGSSEGQAHRCLDYVPGSMLLGALASQWIRKNPKENPDNNNEFKSLFLGNAVRFLNAYPLHGGSRTWPSPLSLKYIKNQFGIPESFNNGTQPVIMNSRAFAEKPVGLERDKAKKLYKERFPDESSQNIQLKKVKPCFIAPETYLRASVAKQWNMHVAIDEKKRKAEDEKLFGYEAISSDAIFESAVLFESDDDGRAVKKLLKNIEYLWVGHSRSAGYGKCEIKLEDINDYTERSAAANHISEGERFNILLLSDYVAKDGWTPPFEGLISDLKEEFGCDITLHNDILPFSAQREVPGFNSKWRLPRPTRTAIAKGSVITFSAGKPIDSSVITQVMRKGIGGLRREGFGRICVNPEFLKKEQFSSKTSDHGLGSTQKQPSDSPEKPGSAKPSTALRALRSRALRRISDDAARRFLASDSVRKFLDGVNNQHDLFKKPSNTQLSNIRSMAMDTSVERDSLAKYFKEMLGKTPGEQWKKCAVNNFMPGAHKKEHLSEVMKQFLNPDVFDTSGLVDLDRFIRNLPGGLVSDAERSRALERIHRLAVSGLMEAVIVLRRIKDKETEGRGGEKQ